MYRYLTLIVFLSLLSGCESSIENDPKMSIDSTSERSPEIIELTYFQGHCEKVSGPPSVQFSLPIKDSLLVKRIESDEFQRAYFLTPIDTIFSYKLLFTTKNESFQSWISRVEFLRNKSATEAIEIISKGKFHFLFKDESVVIPINPQTNLVYVDCDMVFEQFYNLK